MWRFGTARGRSKTCAGFAGGASIGSIYRHIIEWLVRKPGAFENYRYQEDLFPTSRFRMAYDALKETTPSRSSKEYVKILKLAAEAGEVQVDEALRELLERKAGTGIKGGAIG